MMMRYLDEAVETCEHLIKQLAVSADSSHASSPNATDTQASSIQDWTQACQTVSNVLTGMGFVEESYPWRLMALDAEPNSAKFYAESSRVYSQCEAWDKAIYFCQRTLEHQPDSVGVRCLLAKIHHQMGNYRQESQTLSELLTLQPEKATAEGHLNLGRVLVKQGQIQAAARCYERAIAQDARYAAAYYALVELWSQQQRWNEAVELLTRLIATLERAETIQPSVDLAADVSVSEQAVTDAAAENRENGTNQTSSRVAEQAMAHYRLGRVYRQSGQLEQAVAQFRRALKLDAHLHWAYMGLLNTLMQMQRWDEVIEPCQKLAHRAKEFPWIYSFMGNALAGKGEWQQAAIAHRQAFALRGWTACAEREYSFGRTWFAQSIATWETHLADAIPQSAARSPIQALSLGAQDAAALCWLVDCVLTQSNDRLLCLTPQVRKPLETNADKLAQPNKLVCRTGEILPMLSNIANDAADGLSNSAEQFSLIVIQSDRKDASYLSALAAEAWAQLIPGGLLLIKNCQWRHPSDPKQSSRVGIDAFVASVSDRAEVLHRSHEMIVKKTAVQQIRNETAPQEIPNV